MALLCFGLALSRQGWSVHYLGADMPIEAVLGGLDALRPDAVVLAAMEADRFEPVRRDLRRLARRVRLLLAGPGATDALARAVGAEVLVGDPVTAARALAPARR
jgi:methanogenic corrinoid protein MtbC1